jgi:hypothetical protein
MKRNAEHIPWKGRALSENIRPNRALAPSSRGSDPFSCHGEPQAANRAGFPLGLRVGELAQLS